MDPPDRGALLYEGKAKRLYATADPELLLVEYKDDATAFNAQKRGTIAGKGAINNAVSERLFRVLEAAGVPTHLVERTSATEQVVRKVEIVPLEVVVRNRAAGSFAQRYGVEEGLPLEPIVVEWCYKNDALADPPLNDASAVALGLASEDELATMFELAAAINDTLGDYFATLGLELIDFKVEFGRTTGGAIVLADEISADTCRLWDLATGERLDKDRFRRDLGNVAEAYQDVHDRVMSEAGDPARFGAAHIHAPAGMHAAVVNVMLKRSILDPQGRAVQNTLARLGHANVADLRVGKRIEISLQGAAQEVAAQLKTIAETVLSNPVMEKVEVEFIGSAESGAAVRGDQPEAADSAEAPLATDRHSSSADGD